MGLQRVRHISVTDRGNCSDIKKVEQNQENVTFVFPVSDFMKISPVLSRNDLPSV